MCIKNKKYNDRYFNIEEGRDGDFMDYKTDRANWIVFKVCPSCSEEIKDDQRRKCFRCCRLKLFKPVLGDKFCCAWCYISDLGNCYSCGKKNIKLKDLRDHLSYKEFSERLNHCQDCQDKVFNKCSSCKKYPKLNLQECKKCDHAICEDCRKLDTNKKCCPVCKQ